MKTVTIVVVLAAGCAVTAHRTTTVAVAQQPPAAAARPGTGLTERHFRLLDANGDDAITRDDLQAALGAWHTRWDADKDDALAPPEVFRGAGATFPPYTPGDALPPNKTPDPADVTAMLAALPDAAPARPRRPRKVLVFGRAAGFVHSSIPLAARTVEEIGKKTGAWSTTISYDAGDITDVNLQQYDAIVLASTTGEFLDDPSDAAATAARRKALIDFVRGGKGLAGIHAATDGYHRNAAPGAAGGLNLQLLPLILQMLAADRNADGRLSRDELAGLADGWYEKLDPEKRGRVGREAFLQRYGAVVTMPRLTGGAGAASGQGPATNREPDTEVGTWPEFNAMIGAIFKFHWNDGQSITVKIDEPNHPVNAAFTGQPWVIVDETYTFSRTIYDRKNLRVLTSIDYAAMSAEDKAKEQHPRTDGDYALSWVRREGKGRVFYEAHGHNEKVYANPQLLRHLTAGLQYVLGDLAADDSPSAPAAK